MIIYKSSSKKKNIHGHFIPFIYVCMYVCIKTNIYIGLDMDKYYIYWENPHGVGANALNYNIVVCGFQL